MLVLSRKKLEVIYIGNDIKVVVGRISRNSVSLAIDAPKQLKITRGELLPKSIFLGQPGRLQRESRRDPLALPNEVCAANAPTPSVLLAKCRASAGRPGGMGRAEINSGLPHGHA
jgi:carbon storage regulator